jgi:hypothetical protein
LISVVHIMSGRRSPVSHLGLLELEGGMLTLRDGKGQHVFGVPAVSAQARPARRRSFETHRTGFEVQVNDRWWFLVAHTVPAKYQRRATRELIERYGAQELVPRPPGMSEETYHQVTNNPVQHQALWAAFWIETLNLGYQGSERPSR